MFFYLSLIIMLDTVSCAFSLQKFDVEGILGASGVEKDHFIINAFSNELKF